MKPMPPVRFRPAAGCLLLLASATLLLGGPGGIAHGQDATRLELVRRACGENPACREAGRTAVQAGHAVQRVMAAACSMVEHAPRAGCYERAFAAAQTLSTDELLMNQEPLLGEEPFGMDAASLRAFFAENTERCAGRGYRCYQGKLQFLDLRITFGRHAGPFTPRDDE